MRITEKFAQLRGLGSYFLLLYFLLLPITGCFALLVPEFDPMVVVFLLLAVPGYSLLYLLPVMLLSGIFAWAFSRIRREKVYRLCVFGATALVGGFAMLLLVVDLLMYRLFDFHFNMMVFNLLTTPGGFASMGLRSGTLLTLAGMIAGFFLIHLALGELCRRAEWPAKLAIKFTWWKRLIVVAVLALGVLGSSIIYGYEHFMLHPAVLDASSRVPLFIPMTIKGVMKGLGFSAPSATVLRIAGHKSLNYPQAPIVRGEHRKYNVIWLVGESWRADTVTPEIMPNVAAFARESLNFTNHYSGGNGTRMGMFSMFYGLYGHYWHEFLRRNRAPLFMDWLREDGYDFFCSTSAKFSYPEFDRTIFAQIPAEKLHSDDDGVTWSRDQRNLKRILDFLKDKPAQPFFLFHFFESPHAPYEFPRENALYPDAARSINYATVSPEDAPALKKRYHNACHHLDECLGKIFAQLKAQGLWESTIIVLTGDHGEEFYEKGHLGHNSTFAEEQIRPPLFIRIPGVSPRKITKLSSHLDIIPILAPYWGVQNPSRDYSLGMDITRKDVVRKYVILADWNRLAFANGKFKTNLPMTAAGFATQKLYDGNDRALPDKNEFYKECGNLLLEIQKDAVRFNN